MSHFVSAKKALVFSMELRPVGSDKRESCLETTMTQWNTMRFVETWVPSKVAKGIPYLQRGTNLSRWFPLKQPTRTGITGPINSIWAVDQTQGLM